MIPIVLSSLILTIHVINMFPDIYRDISLSDYFLVKFSKIGFL